MGAAETMNIFVSCGEPSGDVYAGDLIRSLKKIPDVRVWGMLGHNGINSGGDAVFDYGALHLMGIVEVIPAIPRLFKLRNEIAQKILDAAPACVVVIDSPDFHLPLIKKLRKDGYKGKIIYLVTPTVWAWRSGRAETLKKYCDLCLPLFSFENDWLVNYGINSAWKVHPLAETLQNYTPPKNLVEKYKNKRVVAFMPGSRSYDIRWHSEALLESAALVGAHGYTPVFSIAPGLRGKLRDDLIARVKNCGFEFCEEEGRALLSICEASAGVSGTISMEAMLLSRFMVVVYAGNFISWLVWKLFIHAPYISIPNMLAEKQIFPELLSKQMTAGNIAYELVNYLEGETRKNEINSLISNAVSKMGKGDAGEFWAQKIWEL